MDAATGLLYVGNGQYYDPSTGRFLTRSAKPNQNNPYTPFDPMGALFAPLGLMALVYGNKKKGGKWNALLVILIFAVVVGMTLTACGDGSGNGNGNPPPTETPPPGTPPGGAGNDSGGGTPTPTPPVETPIPCDPCPPLTLADKFRITADEITQAGNMAAYFEKEIRDDPALFMARVAMGESADNGERRRIIWLITIRVVLAFNNSNLRSGTTMGSSIWDHYGPPSDLHREVLEISPNNRYQFEDVEDSFAVFNPPAEPIGNIHTMLYPDDAEISDFESMYKVAGEALGAQNENALKQSPNSDLGDIKGYDGYLAPEEGGVTSGTTGRYYGGEISPKQFTTNSGNVWDDFYPMDNVFFGKMGCEDEKGLIRFFYDPSSQGQGDWLTKLFFKSDPDQVACPN
jgi:hypothetical protein